MRYLIGFMAICLVFCNRAFAENFNTAHLKAGDECAFVQSLGAKGQTLAVQGGNFEAKENGADNGILPEISGDKLQAGENEGLDSVDISEIQEQVNALLNKVLPGAKVVSMDEVRQNGVMVIKCKVSYNGFELLFNVNPKTGAISKFESNKGNFVTSHPEITTSKPGVKITQHQVNKILNDKIPGASVKKLKYDKKKGIVSGHSLYKGMEFYFEIDAVRGNVIKFEPVE